ncbi:MAG: tyrosine-type recombinase/integrase [Lachnospiraceae bacterium]|nr:tyrosine-type recombinase/integrase [Lachnospiraceae bacterium]
MARKDSRGRNLRTGERQRENGLYEYRYNDPVTGKMDVNTLFERYIEARKLADQTRENYIRMWNCHVKDEIGRMKVVEVRPSHVKLFYARLSKAGYSRSTIKLLHDMLYPAFEMAVDDDIIRKNPCKMALRDFGRDPEAREAITNDQQEKLLAFVRDSNVYNVYFPMLVIMIGTACRCGEIIGLTWSDIDMKNKQVSITHQLIYKNLGEGSRLCVTTPKTEAGIRDIPMTASVRKAFEKQREYQFMMGIDRDYEVDGMKGFIFTSKNGRPLQPSAVNNVLYNIVDAYNKQEAAKAKKEHRKLEMMPRISAHILRHTGCTRMAERGMDVKVLQYIMGHANIAVTMEVYNHITEYARIEKEILKMEDLMVV